MRCSQPKYNGCPGRARLLNGVLTITRMHTMHAEHPGLLESNIAKEYVRKRAAETLNPKKILYQELLASRECQAAVNQDPDWIPEKMHKIINRSRESVDLPDVQNLDEFHDVLNSQQWHTLLTCDGDFMTSNLYILDNQRLMILFDGRIIQQLVDVTEITISSSSYKSLPDTSEVITVHAVENARLYKCLWFFVSQKTRDMYNQVVNLINEQLPNVTRVFTSWDMDLLEVSNQVWPEVYATWYSQTKSYRQDAIIFDIDLHDPENKVIFRKLCCLSLIPTQMIRAEFMTIVDGLDEQKLAIFQPLLDSIRNFWLGVLGAGVMSCLVDNNHVQQLKLGLYEIKNDTLLDSLKVFQTMEPSLYKYIEYVIRANHETLNDLRRNTNISDFSPKIIEKSKVYKQLKKLWNRFDRQAVNGQLGLAKLIHFYQIFLNNLLERPQPLPPGFRVAEVVNINGEDIFAVNIQEYIWPGNRQLVLHQENMYQEHLQPRNQQQEVEQVGQQQQEDQQHEEQQQEEQQQEEELVDEALPIFMFNGERNHDENPEQDVGEVGVQFDNHLGELCSIRDTLADRALACLHKF